MSDDIARPGTVAEAARALIASAEFHPSAPSRVSVDRDAFLALRLMLDNPEYRVRVVYDDEPYDYGDVDPLEGESVTPLAVIVEYRYGAAEPWEPDDSIWGIGFLDSDRSLVGIPEEGHGERVAGPTYTADDVREWLADDSPPSLHYLGEIAKDLLPDHLL